MTSVYPRFTVGQSVSWSGVGLHSGLDATIRLHPGEEGLWLRQGYDRFPVGVAEVSSTERCTCLRTVGTVEHFLAALAGLGLTDGEIEIDGREVPGLDGSAQGFVEGLAAGGKVLCGKLEVEGPFARVYLPPGLPRLSAGKGEGHWRYVYDRGDLWPGQQASEVFLTPSTFARELAPARTVVLTEELEMVRKLGLGRGLSEQSVVIIGQTGYEGSVRFENEPARHKLLDLIGDISLTGCPLNHLNVVSEKGGHSSNIALAKKLSEAIRIERLKS